MFSGSTSFARSDGLARRRGRPEGGDGGISLRAPPRIPQGIPHPSQAATYRNSLRSWVQEPRRGKSTRMRASRSTVDGTPSGSSASYVPVYEAESRLVESQEPLAVCSLRSGALLPPRSCPRSFFKGILLFGVRFLVARATGL